MAENLKLNIFDLVSKDEIEAYRNSKDAFDDQFEDLRYGIDYHFIVESFLCEYKLDVKELKSLQNQYASTQDSTVRQHIVSQFRALYPECPDKNIQKAKIPDTILKKAYFVQSPKGYDGLPSVHYSLKEKMLSDLRATRGRVKKDMKVAMLNHDSVSETRYNAKQLAIKVVMNSEYGAANNEYFAHYDPDVASAVTRGARRLINFLTNNLESDNLFVDNKFLNEYAKQIKNLEDIDVLSVEPVEDTSTLLTNRRHCIRRLFDDSYNIIQKNIFKINIKPSVVCYQDTDSNYYKNEYIADYYTKMDGEFVCDPETIDKCMHSMLAHNELLGAFIKFSIARRPYELGFEGAFIVCRYLNRKKKYYGIKWGDDAELRLTAKIDNPLAYEQDGEFLIQDYSPYWQPKKTVIPQPNGDYIFIDADMLLHKGVNYLDYVHDQDVKVTGVDLARRDQYNFINFFHIVVLQKDLRVMKYDGYGLWTTFAKDEPMIAIIDNVVETFHQIILQYQAIAELQTDVKPEYDFNILDFAKNAAYKPGKQNMVSTIVKRLNREGKFKYLPKPTERVSFVTVLDQETKKNRAEGKAKKTNTGERSYLVSELLDYLHSEYPESSFNDLKAAAGDVVKNLSYDDFINAKAIGLIDIKWYLEYLCKSVALYIVGDKFPDEIRRIDEGEIPVKEAGAHISRFQEKISKEYVNRYFPRDKEYARAVKQQEKKAKLSIKANRQDLNKRYPDIDFDSLSLSQYDQICSDLERAHNEYNDLIKYQQDVWRDISTDKFYKPSYKNQVKQAIYDRFKQNPQKLLKCIDDTYKRLENIRACELALDGVIKPELNQQRLEYLKQLEEDKQKQQEENEEYADFI